jgi:excisionase family DNA binding protein
VGPVGRTRRGISWRSRKDPEVIETRMGCEAFGTELGGPNCFRQRTGGRRLLDHGWAILKRSGPQGCGGVRALAKDDEIEILTPQEAAEFLRVPLLTVQRQAKAGRLPGRRVGKEWRFSRTMLLEWVASGPDRHDLELYDRRGREDSEQRLDEEEPPGAGGTSQQD